MLQAAIDPKAQLLVLMRYVFAFTLSAVKCTRENRATSVCQKHSSNSSNSSGNSSVEAADHSKVQQQQCAVKQPAVPAKVKIILLLMGMLDLASYAIFNIGYAAAGSALAAVVLAATGQICTAVLSVAILHRRLSRKHIAAVAIVTMGLVLRSADDIDISSIARLVTGFKAGATASSSSSSNAAGGMGGSAMFGVGCVALSALLFSVLGCMYEVLMNADEGHSVTQAQVGWHGGGGPISFVSTAFAALCLFRVFMQFLMTGGRASSACATACAADRQQQRAAGCHLLHCLTA
jgi:drug/metabolite transporter (DMT)-like permease